MSFDIGPWYYCRQRPTLPHSFPCSTIGGIRLNFRVRNGNGCDPDPMTTGILVGVLGVSGAPAASDRSMRSLQACLPGVPPSRAQYSRGNGGSSQTILSKNSRLMIG